MSTFCAIALALAGCVTVPDSDEPDRPREPLLQPDLQPAPIDDVDLRIAGSNPPQYMLYVQAGLPSGCASPHSHDVTRDGSVVRVSVTNSVLQSDACTMVYGSYEITLDLGGEFRPGHEYAIEVNDERFLFVAQ